MHPRPSPSPMNNDNWQIFILHTSSLCNNNSLDCQYYYRPTTSNYTEMTLLTTWKFNKLSYISKQIQLSGKSLTKLATFRFFRSVIHIRTKLSPPGSPPSDSPLFFCSFQMLKRCLLCPLLQTSGTRMAMLWQSCHNCLLRRLQFRGTSICRVGNKTTHSSGVVAVHN